LPTGHNQTKQQYPQKQISAKPITQPATNQPPQPMPTIANQQHRPTQPTKMEPTNRASNFGRTGTGDCFFQITGDFGAVRFFSNTRSETWPPISPTVSMSVHGRKKK